MKAFLYFAGPAPQRQDCGSRGTPSPEYPLACAYPNDPSDPVQGGYFSSGIFADWKFLVPGAGVEPARPEGQGILSPPRMPFRHPGAEGVSLSY